MKESEYLTIGEVADLLDCSRRTIQKWRAAGWFLAPDIERGKVVRWSRTRLLNWIDDGGMKKSARRGRAA